MNPQLLALVILFATNAAAFTLLGVLLYRMFGQLAATQDTVDKRTAFLADAGKQLQQQLTSVDRLTERMHMSLEKLSELPQSLRVSMQDVEALGNLSDAMSPDSMQGHERLLDDMRELLESLGNVRPDTYAQWQQVNQRKLEQAMAQRGRAAAELEQLKLRLNDANLVINELRRANRMADTNAQAAEVLRQNLDQQQVLLGRAKERARKAETELEALRLDAAKLQSELDAAASRKQSAEDTLKGQMEAIAKERDLLFSQLEAMRDEMQRTQREKDFIEDKLLDLDQVARST